MCDILDERKRPWTPLFERVKWKWTRSKQPITNQIGFCFLQISTNNWKSSFIYEMKSKRSNDEYVVPLVRAKRTNWLRISICIHFFVMHAELCKEAQRYDIFLLLPEQLPGPSINNQNLDSLWFCSQWACWKSSKVNVPN